MDLHRHRGATGIYLLVRLCSLGTPLLIVESNHSAAYDRSKHVFFDLVVKRYGIVLSCRTDFDEFENNGGGK